MKDTELFDSYMRLSAFHVEKWKVRNAMEWRVPFALWAILIVSLIYVHVRPDETALCGLLVALFAGYVYFWAFPVAALNHYELNVAHRYVELAEIQTGRNFGGKDITLPSEYRDLSPEERRPINRRVFRSAAFRFQVATTAILAIVVYLFMGSAVLRDDDDHGKGQASEHHLRINVVTTDAEHTRFGRPAVADRAPAPR